MINILLSNHSHFQHSWNNNQENIFNELPKSHQIEKFYDLHKTTEDQLKLCSDRLLDKWIIIIKGQLDIYIYIYKVNKIACDIYLAAYSVVDKPSKMVSIITVIEYRRLLPNVSLIFFKVKIYWE